RLDLDTELLDRALLELFDPQPLLGADHLVAVHLVGEPGEFLGELTGAGAQREQLPFAHYPLVLQPVALGDGHPQRRGDVLEDGRRGVADLGGDHGTPGPGLAGLLLTAPGLALGLSGPGQLLGPPGHRPDPLLAGADRQARLHLALPGLRDPKLEVVTL